MTVCSLRAIFQDKKTTWKTFFIEEQVRLFYWNCRRWRATRPQWRYTETPLCCSVLRVCVGTGFPCMGHSGQAWLWPSRARCVMSDIKVDFNLIKIGVLVVVLRWGIPLSFVALGWTWSVWQIWWLAAQWSLQTMQTCRQTWCREMTNFNY